MPALDGLRGLSIALVVAAHYFHFPAGGGSTGVGLFFILSGYLITTLLLEEYDATGRIRLGAFYARRARRLVPALAVMLAAYLVGAILQGHGDVALRATAASAFYTANIAHAYWPHLVGHEPITPLWSLAEEEQFYLLWPPLLILLLALAWRPRAVKAVLVLAIVTICAERFYLFASDAPYARMFSSPETAADGLLAGVLLAFLLRRGYLVREARLELGFAAVALLGIISAYPFTAAVYRPVLDFAGAVLVGLATQPGLVSRALSWRPLVWLGLISYSLYLWHLVVLSWFADSAYRDGGAPLLVALGIAWLSYRYVEAPFRRRRVERLDGGRLKEAVVSGLAGDVAA